MSSDQQSEEGLKPATVAHPKPVRQDRPPMTGTGSGLRQMLKPRAISATTV